jgi:hypothetical protein
MPVNLSQDYSVISKSKLGAKRVTMIFKASGAPGIVQRQILKLPGVVRARVNIVHNTVWVEYDPSLVTETKVKEVCSNAG